jgi:hypothetical protein
MDPRFRLLTNVVPEDLVESKEVRLDSETNCWNCIEVLRSFHKQAGIIDIFLELRVIGSV